MSSLNPGGEHRTVLMGDDELVLKIKLPRGIGYVLIDTREPDHKGRPEILVEAVSEATEEHLATDGRLYYTETSRLHDNRVYMTGYKPEETY